MSKYDHRSIEAKWQRAWEHEQYGRAEDTKGEKSYVLVEFPYPSGDGLHVGHVRSYTALDAIARKRRMEGKNVLFPIGWDAFGLPTENYALKTGVHPRVATDTNITNFRTQMKRLGLSFDWSREVDTTDPKYYKWTQWIFLQLFKRGLAYQATIPISWCPKDKIGLANEEVVGGKCERCGTVVERRMQKQWMLKITAYAKRLLKDLDTVDYLPRIKTQQQNWIGKSEGAEVTFEIEMPKQVRHDKKKVLIGTRNVAKIGMIKKAFARVADFEFVSLNDLPDIDDSALVEGDDDMENARRKSEFYFERTRIPTISTDHFLWIEKWPKNNGVIRHIRKLANPKSPRATDEEMITWYQKFLASVGGSSKSRFDYAIAYTDAGGTSVFRSKGVESILQTEQASHYPEGYPTEAFLKDPKTGKFRVDQSKDLQHESIATFLQTKVLARIIGGAKETRMQIPDQVRNDIVQGDMKKSVIVFTTRPDTLFGATYLVLSPEHPLVDEITTSKQKKAVAQYRKKVANKSDLERTSLEKVKTGVFTGAYAVNPVNNEKIPIWIADYVLMSYGTGAIMAVPAHDERDHEFAKKFKLPITQVVAPYFKTTEGPDAVRDDKPTVRRKTMYAFVKHHTENKYLCLDWEKYNWHSGVIGGIEENESTIEAATREIREETGYQNLKCIASLGGELHNHFYAGHKNENRYAVGYGLLFQLVNDKKKPIEQEHTKNHAPMWIEGKDMAKWLNLPNFLYMWEILQTGRQYYTGEGVAVNSGKFDGLSSEDGRKKIVVQLEKDEKAKIAVHYKLRDWVFSRQHYWGEPIPLTHCEHCRHVVESTPWVLNFYERAWNQIKDGEKIVETRALNPDEPDRYFGDIKVGDLIKGVLKGTSETMYLKIKSRQVFKNLEELFANREVVDRIGDPGTEWTLETLQKAFSFTPDYLKRIEKNGMVAWEVKRIWPGVIPLKEKDLPLELPDVKKYEPTGTGESPLATIDEWVNVTCRVCGHPAKRETDTMPNWAGSSWYFLRYCDPRNSKEFASRKKLDHWMPVDLYNGGMEHTTLHLLYSRFWHKFLYDQGLVPTPEPYQKRVSHGMVLASDGRKMSKSFGNVVNPDELIEQYGADSVRLYEMFMGPFEDAIPWDTKGIVGMRRFLQRVWDARERVEKCEISRPQLRLIHTLTKFVTTDIENLKFNTCISDLMEYSNTWRQGTISQEEFERFLKLLSPFAPHLAEELWTQLGHKTLVSMEPWPTYDEVIIKKSEVNIAVQVNGKLRGTVVVSVGAPQKDVEAAAVKESNVAKFLIQTPKKVIFVKDRLINFVV